MGRGSQSGSTPLLKSMGYLKNLKAKVLQKKGVSSSGKASEDGGTPPKKAKSIGNVVESNTISEVLLAEVKLTTMPKDTAMLQLRASNTIYILNMATSEIALSQWIFLAGFGKGTFKLLTSEEETRPSALGLGWNSSDNLVVFNGTVISLEKVVNDQRASKPECRVCYHNITANEDCF